MEDLKFGLIMQHRSFPNGEREGDRGLPNRIVAVQECDFATGKVEGNGSSIVVVKPGT